MFREKILVVIGGGDSAIEEANHLTHFASKVIMLVRRDVFRASKAMQNRVLNTPNIEIHYNTDTEEILGDGKNVTGVKVSNNLTKETKVLDVTGFFVAIGHNPNTEIFKGILDMDETGYLITEADSTKTNIPGVFACGDAQDKLWRQAVTAAGTGCMAALEAERYLAAAEHGSH